VGVDHVGRFGYFFEGVQAGEQRGQAVDGSDDQGGVGVRRLL
jgi:hypothetical protein